MARVNEFNPRFRDCIRVGRDKMDAPVYITNIYRMVMADRHGELSLRDAHMRGVVQGATDYESVYRGIDSFQLIDSSMYMHGELNFIDDCTFVRSMLRLYVESEGLRGSRTAEVTCSDFIDCNLGILGSSKLRKTRFSNCRLRGVKFGRSFLTHVYFVNCDLTGSDFSEVVAREVFFVDCQVDEKTPGLILEQVPYGTYVKSGDVRRMRWGPVVR